MTKISQEQKADKLYQQYAKPLEEKHIGEFLAISQDGQHTLLGKSLLEVVKKAKKLFGSESFIFKVGTRSVGTWR